MNNNRVKDEHIERLFYLNEGGNDSIDELEISMSGSFDNAIIDDLVYEGIVVLTGDGKKINFTKNGTDHALRIIRAHRIAEMLIYNVLGSEFESGACEFEHIVTPEIVDSICILLGHPRECPHGMPIPEGDCCKQSARIAKSSVIPLTELKVGQSARIAYIKYKNDHLIHRIDSFQIRPKVFVKLHQIYPSYVIECEGANIALDENIVSSIFVWKNSSDISNQMNGIHINHQSEMRGEV